MYTITNMISSTSFSVINIMLFKIHIKTKMWNVLNEPPDLSFATLIEAGISVPSLSASPLHDLLPNHHVVEGSFGWELCWDHKERISAFADSLLKLQAYTKHKVKVTTTWIMNMVCAYLNPLLPKLNFGGGLAGGEGL